MPLSHERCVHYFGKPRFTLSEPLVRLRKCPSWANLTAKTLILWRRGAFAAVVQFHGVKWQASHPGWSRIGRPPFRETALTLGGSGKKTTSSRMGSCYQLGGSIPPEIYLRYPLQPTKVFLSCSFHSGGSLHSL